jgi:nucleoside-diphosphate-sugar epimerase
VGIYDAAKGAQPSKVYTAKDWSPLTYEDGVNAPNPAVAYRASKAVGERAAWKWMDDNPAVSFDLVSLNPGMVFGAFLPAAAPSSLAGLNTSNKLIWDVVSAGEANEVPPTKAPVWVSVEDTALAHIKALQTPEARGERYLLAAGVYCNQEIADVARGMADNHADRIPKGNPGAREVDKHFGVDSSATEKGLSIEWRKLPDVLAKLVPQLYQIEAATNTAW